MTYLNLRFLNLLVKSKFLRFPSLQKAIQKITILICLILKRIMPVFLIFNPFFLLLLMRAMHPKTIFLSLLNYLINRSRNGRSRRNELKKSTRFIEHLAGANPLEIFLRMTVLIAKSVNSAITIKLIIKIFIRAGLTSIRITLTSWKQQSTTILE